MPESTALWLPLMRGTLTKPAETADQRTAGEGQLRHRLITAFSDRTRAVGDALGALEGVTDGRMRLEPLELFEGEEVGVLVVQVHDEADGHQIVVQVV